MKAIGIDQDRYLLYEGQLGWGQAIWPQPTLLAASVVDESSEELAPAPNDLLFAPFVFIDEGYDPVSRVRRGRLFEKPDTPKQEWHLYPHPAVPGEQAQAALRNGQLTKWLATFWEFRWAPKMKQLGIERPLILLGTKDQFTVWSVIAVEASISGEAIVYLKGRKTFGALPRILYEHIQEEFRDQVRKKIEYLAAEINVAGPESVVDAVREAMTAVLSAYAQQNGLAKEGRDIGDLANAFANHPDYKQKDVVINLAKTAGRLHSRRKNAVQEKLKTREIVEQDAELAIQCIGTVLCDLGWASWV